MNKRNKAIVDWIKEHRPDCSANVSKLIKQFGDEPNNQQVQAVMLLMMFGFEAGRQFQHDTNPELNNPNVY